MLTTDGFRLDGKVALITGSGRNIGRAIAECFAAAGARVVINGHRDQAALDETAAAIRANGGEALPILADVSDHHAVRGMIDETVTTFGGIDIVVSNVGIRKYRAFLDTSPEDWDDVLRSNLSPAFYLSRYAIPHMREKKFGRIIVISGADGFWGHVTHRAPNVASKIGMHGLAKAIALEFGPDNITANTVAPGPIDTVRDWSQVRASEAGGCHPTGAARPLRTCRRDRRGLPVPGRPGGRLRHRPGDPRERRQWHVTDNPVRRTDVA